MGWKQKGVKIIISRDVTFNENEMPCIKEETEPESKTEPGKERDLFKVELGKFSTPTPTAPNEVEIQEQSPYNERDCNEREGEYMSKVPYSNVIGSIMYLMICTRSDLDFAVSTLSRYMANLGPEHWEALKWLLKYLKGYRDGRKSTSSYMFTLSNSCSTIYTFVQEPHFSRVH
ncbi:uncharacterized protein LOC111383922 [Olea europaea var. sylvestris]|uniref:uncharacterized protein LOC111383922 n=1 Tax=Olea europaea var. sylvestris TaxID=158386 RepID=UPI000C1D554A|nr:uncharacterized protein LOC111383922 [Olea europaea var. sylvestris]